MVKRTSYGHCFVDNNKEFPLVCDSECQKNRCGKDLNKDYMNYNPDIDFSNCVYDETKQSCVEKRLNIISGGGCEISSIVLIVF